MRRKKLLIVSVICLLISCQTEHIRYEALLKQNFASLDSVRSYIENGIREKKFGDNQVGLLFTLESQYSRHKNIIFDPLLVSKMNSLKIKQIRCDTEKREACGTFDTIYFQLIQNENSRNKVVYFVYDRCDKLKDFESQKIYQKKLFKNWGVLIELD